MSGIKHSIIFKLCRFVFTLILIVILLFAGVIGFLSVTEYKPKDRESIRLDGKSKKSLRIGDSISVLSWNIGYGALGDNADFFMDGGKSVNTADENRVNDNILGITRQIKSINPDVIFFQEIDKNSTRSKHIDEYEDMINSFKDYSFSFANNFKVAFLPYPVPPIGKVDSGIATASAFKVTESERIQLPVPFSWPVRMANLKRCVLVSRIPIENSEKELVLLNLHLEAYDNGKGKIAQTKMLAELLKIEDDKGNYVIAGGDFNQIFSTSNRQAFAVKKGMWEPGEIDTNEFGDEWQFLMDESVPSCRSLDKAYKGADKDSFQYYLIDGFIASNNLHINSLKTQNLDFVNSDHNPVLINITLSED
ncbi:MAG: endonuclease [Clostridia bacterium]|nr:endonuclease [Clostridia bacterium]